MCRRIVRSQRTYAHLIAIRAVNSVDAMTAEWTRSPYDLELMAQRIIAEVDGVNRVIYDITSKTTRHHRVGVALSAYGDQKGVDNFVPLLR